MDILSVIKVVKIVAGIKQFVKLSSEEKIDSSTSLNANDALL